MVTTPDSFTRALWQSYQQRHLGASKKNGRKSEDFVYQNLICLSRSFTCRKILGHGTSGFTTYPKEGVLLIFIAVKNPSPRPSLNPRPFDPVASTLITTPPRRLPHYYYILFCHDRFLTYSPHLCRRNQQGYKASQNVMV
jgi:hypothetical protein